MEIKKGQIIIHPPGHPMMLLIYTMSAIIVAWFASGAILTASSRFGGLGLATGYLIGLLLMLSPPLSFLNLVIGFLRTRYFEHVLEVNYISFAGIPIPVPRISLVERKTILAINIGGGVIPVISSFLILTLMLLTGMNRAIESSIVAVIITSIVTFYFSRVIQGVGIAVPALIPPLTSSIVVASLMGDGPLSALAAYVGGTLGALIGADVLRLLKDLEKLSGPLVSIGGAGVFDGVFLSGVIALFLTY